jgi:hypothetical protein
MLSPNAYLWLPELPHLSELASGDLASFNLFLSFAPANQSRISITSRIVGQQKICADELNCNSPE